MPEGNGNRAPGSTDGYLLFAWSPSGYTLHERDGDPPAVGTELEDSGNELVVMKVGASPLPGDARPCAFTTGRVQL
ncbi:MAG TPA: hypothetical protein VGM80_06440 [Gaiellaceae bacterium]|jgi:hypothetical protein